jgi:hypothetical protein
LWEILVSSKTLAFFQWFEKIPANENSHHQAFRGSENEEKQLKKLPPERATSRI